MSFFKKLFNQGDALGKGEPDSEVTKFDAEFIVTIPRYISTPEAKVDLRARHHQTNELIPYAIAFPEYFEQWKQIRSIWDRRSLIYSVLDQQIGNQLELWQAIERFTIDRYPQKALEIAAQNVQPKDLEDANFFAATAKAKFVLTQYAEAESDAKKSLQIESQHRRGKTVLADIYHFTGKESKAHEIYDQLLQERLSGAPSNTSLNFTELVGFDADILHSPIYAAAWLKSDPKSNTEIWDWAGGEFYYNPHFRSQHAYYLIGNEERMKGFAKLLSLSQEMPWYKEAVINSRNLIDQLGLENDAEMKNEKHRLQALMCVFR